MANNGWSQVIEVDGDTAYLHLTHVDGRKQTHLCDADLVPKVRALAWRHTYDGYAQAIDGNGDIIYLDWLALGMSKATHPYLVR